MATEPIERQTIRTLEEKGRKAVEKKFASLEELVIEYVKLDSIFPNSYNPNRQSERDFELLKKSIMEDGFTQPIIVQKKSREIVDGEHRWRAMHQLGFTTIPVVFVDMTDQQQRISTLRHNRARGNEDIELTSSILRDLRELGALDQATESLSLSSREINALLDDLPATEANASKEFANAWIPIEMAGKESEYTTISNRRISVTDTAQKTMQAIEKAVDGTPDHVEKTQQSLQMRTEIVRVTVNFQGEDAILVKSMLEPSPAQKLLNLCKSHVKNFASQYDDETVAIVGAS